MHTHIQRIKVHLKISSLTSTNTGGKGLFKCISGRSEYFWKPGLGGRIDYYLMRKIRPKKKKKKKSDISERFSAL